MADLNSVYDKQEEIPEAFRPLFTEKGGKWELHGIKGIKPESAFAAVNEALRKERGDHAATRVVLKSWEGLTADEVRATLDTIPELTARANAANDPKKLDEIVAARMAGVTAPLERKLKKYDTDFAALTAENTTLKQAATQRTVHDAVRQAAAELKVLPEAVEDVLMWANATFVVGEDGKVIVKDGVAGVPPGLDPKAWLQDMAQRKAHWWPPSAGGGSRGGQGGGGNFSNNPFSAEHWNLTAQGAVIKSQGREAANRMAQAAGTTVGGPRPLAKK